MSGVGDDIRYLYELLKLIKILKENMVRDMRNMVSATDCRKKEREYMDLEKGNGDRACE